MNICIFGASSDRISPIYFTEAEQLGRLMAEKGHTLIFGAGKTGLMGAVARGISSLQGKLIGIAPSFFNEPGVLCENCTELILTDTMRERKALMEEQADAFIVLPGGTGTFEEFFEVFTLCQLGQMSKPIAFLNTAGYYGPLWDLMKHTADQGFMGTACLELFSVCNTPEETISYCETHQAAVGSIRRLQDYGK